MASNGSGKELTISERNDSAVSYLRQQRMRRDNWYNSRSKFGGSSDPVVVSYFSRQRARLKREEAETMYEFDWLSRRAVEQPARDATREWISFHHSDNPEKAIKLQEEDERLGGRNMFQEAIRLSRLHGGDLLTIGAWDSGAPEDPLKVDRIKKISFVYNTDRWLSFPRTWYRDIEEDKYGEPETYLVHRLVPIGSLPIVVHESRTIRFDGNELPPVARVRNWGWGASILDNVYDAIRQWGIANQSAASVVPSFITYALKIGNLQQLIANGEWATISARVGEAHAQMATQNLMTYGADEEIQKMGTPVSGLPELLDKFMNIVSGAVDIPKSVLFQGESGSLGGNVANTDRANYFDTIRSYQQNYLRERVRFWLDVIGMPLGLKPGEVEFEFKSLTQTTPAEDAQLYYQTAQADQIYVNTGIVDAPERLAVHRFGGQEFNPAPPTFDTTRMEEIVKIVDKTKVEAGQNDIFGLHYAGDPEPDDDDEGGGGFPGGGGGGGQGASSPDDSDFQGSEPGAGAGSTRTEDSLEYDGPVDLIKPLPKGFFPNEQEPGFLERVRRTVADTMSSFLPSHQEVPPTPVVNRSRKQIIRAHRDTDGSLVAEIEDADHEDTAHPKHVIHPGSHGGHIVGYDHKGEPIYGKPGHHPQTHSPPVHHKKLQHNPFHVHPSHSSEVHVMGQKQSEAKGSNPGGVYSSDLGVKRYVKKYPNTTQVHTEHLANRAYKLLGLNAPQSSIVTNQDGDITHFASDIIEGKTLGQSKLDKHTANKILEGFVADVWLANWDTIGLANDNIIIDHEGKIHRIDHGGALLFRAQGGLKSDQQLSNAALTWDGLQDAKLNPQYSAVFKAAGITNADDLGQSAITAIDNISHLGASTNNFMDILPAANGLSETDRTKIIDALRDRANYLATTVRPRIEARLAGSAHVAQPQHAPSHEHNLPSTIKTGSLHHHIFTIMTSGASAGMSVNEMKTVPGSPKKGGFYNAVNQLVQDGHLIQIKQGKGYIYKIADPTSKSVFPKVKSVTDLFSMNELYLSTKKEVGGGDEFYNWVDNTWKPHYESLSTPASGKFIATHSPALANDVKSLKNQMTGDTVGQSNLANKFKGAIDKSSVTAMSAWHQVMIDSGKLANEQWKSFFHGMALYAESKIVEKGFEVENPTPTLAELGGTPVGAGAFTSPVTHNTADVLHARQRLQKMVEMGNTIAKIDARTKATSGLSKLSAWYEVLVKENYNSSAAKVLQKLKGLGHTPMGVKSTTGVTPQVSKPVSSKLATYTPNDLTFAKNHLAAIDKNVPEVDQLMAMNNYTKNLTVPEKLAAWYKTLMIHEFPVQAAVVLERLKTLGYHVADTGIAAGKGSKAFASVKGKFAPGFQPVYTQATTVQSAAEHLKTMQGKFIESKLSNEIMKHVEAVEKATSGQFALAAWYKVLRDADYGIEATIVGNKLNEMGFTPAGHLPAGGVTSATAATIEKAKASTPTPSEPPAPKPVVPPPSGASASKGKLQTIPQIQFFEHEKGIAVTAELHTTSEMTEHLKSLSPPKLSSQEEQSVLQAAREYWKTGTGKTIIRSYTGESSHGMVSAFYKGKINSDGYQKTSKFVSALIPAPKWTGPMHRKMRLDEDTYKKLMLTVQAHGEVQFNAPQSFSRDFSSALIVGGGQGDHYVNYHVAKSKSGRMVEHISKHSSEKEVIALPQTRYKVSKVVESASNSGIQTDIFMEELT